MNKGILIVLVAAAILVSLSVFTVHEREKAILFQLGQIVKSDYEPGLHFKLPYPFQEVRKFDKRIQNLDADPDLYLTSERKNVKVDSFVKWQIDNVERYFTSSGGNANRARQVVHAINKKVSLLPFK